MNKRVWMVLALGSSLMSVHASGQQALEVEGVATEEHKLAEGSTECRSPRGKHGLVHGGCSGFREERVLRVMVQKPDRSESVLQVVDTTTVREVMDDLRLSAGIKVSCKGYPDISLATPISELVDAKASTLELVVVDDTSRSPGATPMPTPVASPPPETVSLPAAATASSSNARSSEGRSESDS